MYAYIYIYVYVCVCSCICMPPCMYMYVHERKHTHTHTHTHTHSNKHKHTHIDDIRLHCIQIARIKDGDLTLQHKEAFAQAAANWNQVKIKVCEWMELWTVFRIRDCVLCVLFVCVCVHV